MIGTKKQWWGLPEMAFRHCSVVFPTRIIDHRRGWHFGSWDLPLPLFGTFWSVIVDAFLSTRCRRHRRDRR